MAKILVIDDERNMRTFLDLLLREEGYDVLLADDGGKGLDCYCRERPDVILLDLNLPGLDGIEVLKRIRTTDLEQPVIVLTGDTNPDTERQVRALGVSEFIVKGASLDALTDALDHILRSTSSRRET